MIEDLNDGELEAVRRCLIAAADGPFFPDVEFETLFGRTRAEIRRAAESWPDPSALLAARVTLNQLVGYPHGRDAVLQRMVGSKLYELERLLQRLTASS